MNRLAKPFVTATLGALAALVMLLLFEAPHDVDVTTRTVATQPTARAGADSAPPSSETPAPDSNGPQSVPGAEERGIASDGPGDASAAQRPIVHDAKTPIAESANTFSQTPDENLPADGRDVVERPLHWCFLAGTATGGQEWRFFESEEGYFFASDSSTVWNGSRSVALGASVPGRNAVVVWQAVDATPYHGFRVVVSAHVRTTSHPGHFFIGAHNGATPFSGAGTEVWFQSSPASWTRYELALHVPQDAVAFFYGAQILNGGSLWLDDVRVEIVDEETASAEPAVAIEQQGRRPAGVTAIAVMTPPAFLPAPSNLDFEVTTYDADDGVNDVEQRCGPQAGAA